MRLAELRRHWEVLGRTDPVWAVLNQRGLSLEEFFSGGEAEIDAVMARLETLGIDVGRGSCLDFGCGLGRLTQALARYFELVVGVDIAASMVEQARTLNRQGERCRFLLNTDDDLRRFADASFDMVYTRLVLQHMEPAYARGYIAEFLRVLRPGGVAVFQVPSHFDETRAGRRRLPDSALRADLAILEAPTRLVAGDRGEVRVRVRNASGVTWPGLDHPEGDCQVRLGNHWVDARGRRRIRDDGRVSLQRSLAPGDEAIVDLGVTAPRWAGEWRLQVDMVQEGVSWFGDRGSPLAETTVTVRRPPLRQLWRDFRARWRPDTAPTGFVPVIELYGVPREQVERTVADAGGEVLEVADDPCVGMGWVSYRYVVRRRSEVAATVGSGRPVGSTTE